MRDFVRRGPDGVTLGTPVAVLVRNKDQRSQDYGEIAVAYRPSPRGRDVRYEVRCASDRGWWSKQRAGDDRTRRGGAIAKKVLKEVAGTEILAYVSAAARREDGRGEPRDDDDG